MLSFLCQLFHGSRKEIVCFSDFCFHFYYVYFHFKVLIFITHPTLFCCLYKQDTVLNLYLNYFWVLHHLHSSRILLPTASFYMWLNSFLFIFSTSFSMCSSAWIVLIFTLPVCFWHLMWLILLMLPLFSSWEGSF